MSVDGSDVTPSAPKEQALLAVLVALHPQAVSVDRLMEELWPKLSPSAARRVLHVRVAGLRKHFAAVGAADLIESAGSGYRLVVDPERLDVNRFFGLVDRSRREGAAGDPARASSSLRQALGLWRGEPYEGVNGCVSVDAEAARLSDAHLGAVEERIDADLACGQHRRVTSELDGLVVSHPLRERLWEQHVLALYRCDRQVEALRACAELRRRLRDQLGVVPGAPLRALESAVLRQLEELDWVCEIAPPGDTDLYECDAPPVHYARSDLGVNVAYQVKGEGPDLLIVPGFTSHLDVWWASWSGRIAQRLSSFCRLIVFDKRGTGLSDRPAEVGIEDWLDDIEMVLDAAGVERATVFGVSAGGSVATLFAARHPERVRSLVLFGAAARYLQSDDYPIGAPEGPLEAFLERFEAAWGQGLLFDDFCPSAAGNLRLRREFERFERLSASPGAAMAYLRALARIDVRDALPAVNAPTLVIHSTGDRTDPVERARYMAERIPHATMIELDSEDHLIWLCDAREELLDAIEQFVNDGGREMTGATSATVAGRH